MSKSIERTLWTVAALSLGVIVLSCADPAAAQTYVEFRGGINQATDYNLSQPNLPGTELGGSFRVNHGDGWVGEIAAGRLVSDKTRMEISLSHRVSQLDRLSGEAVVDAEEYETAPFSVTDLGTATLSTAMLSGYIDFSRDWLINPYVGAGVGIARATWGGEEEIGAAMQVAAGVAVPLGSSVSLTVDYRILGTFTKMSAFGSDEIMSRSTMAGLRFNF